MRKARNFLPLLVALAIIAGIIVAIEAPFGSDDGLQGATGDAAVLVSGEGLAQELAGELGAGEADSGESEVAVVAEGPRASEIQGIAAWINSPPLTLSDLRGKVVLVDFWTYTCVNCIRTFPYLKLWHSRYADDGLVILGVHSPEFKFEEKLENVQEAVAENGIAWPVALDNDFDTWNAYDNNYWPAKYLVDKDGVIRYTHFGEGAYGETEANIRKLLAEAGAELSDLDAQQIDNQPIDPKFFADPSNQITPELYAGWYRGFTAAYFELNQYSESVYRYGGFVAPREYYDQASPNTVVDYQDSGKDSLHMIFLQGPWYNGRESLMHARETSAFEDYMSVTFSAKAANAVIKPEGEGAGPFKVLLTLDGEYLTEANKGEDVVIEEDGRSFLHVEEPRLYSVVIAPSYGTYKLKLSSDSPHFALYAFTFGVYEAGL